MTQREVNRLVAQATGESVAEIRQLGFSLADPIDIDYDPDSRRPLVFDWDTLTPMDWPVG